MIKMREENLNKYGYVSYNVEEDPFTEEKYVLIDLVYTYPQYRRQGYAEKILMKTITEIKRKHPRLPIRLAALPKENSIDMVDLVEFYEDMGFEVINTSGHAVIMELI